MSAAKSRANARKENMAEDSRWVVQELEKMVFSLDEALKVHSWETMEEINHNMQMFLGGLDQHHLEDVEVQACLQNLQKQLTHFIQACNEHKALFQKELQTKYRRAQAVFTYRMTDGL